MNKKQIISTIAAVCVLVVLVVGAYLLYTNFAKTADGDKTITFVIVSADGTETFTISTDALYLADALLEEGIIAEKAADGYYTTINGIEALWENDEAWWNFTKDGVTCNFGLNEQPIADGDHFEATYTNGFSY